MNDRIKLAEAMGWRVEDRDRIYIPATEGRANGRYGYLPHMSVAAIIPDPFTDANDDYAVLEWARNQYVKWGNFKYALNHDHCAEEYQIGDYARAALKVLS